MRAIPSCALFAVLSLTVAGWAVEKNDTPPFSLPVADAPPAAARFSEKQISQVQAWIHEKAPECPVAISADVAQQLLEEMLQRSPEILDQITAGNFSGHDFDSAILRLVASKLTGADRTLVREEIARRRISAVASLGLAERGALPVDAKAAFEKIKDGSQTQYRRLIDGKMDDDDLQLLIKKVTQIGGPKKNAEADKPKTLSAADIVTEFSRRNQSGSSLQRLQAYVVEGRLKTAAGEPEDLLLFRMRPDSFRLVVRAAGATRYILASKGGHYWQQVPGAAPSAFMMQPTDQRRFLAEFMDPLFVGDDFTFEKLEDGVHEGTKYYRIGVHRPDGSGYIARIDAENFREIGRENADHSTARYSDFREIGGVVFAFKEELSDKAGRSSVLDLVRITPNPGIIQDMFELPAKNGVGYFDLEGFVAPSVAAVKFN